MATRTLSNTSSVSSGVSLLRRTLTANGSISGVSGVLFILGAGMIAPFMGVPDAPGIIAALGFGLVIFAAFVLWVVARPELDRRAVIAIFVMDITWIVGSAAILLANAFGLSTEGRWLVLILADVVSVFALMEFIGLRRMGR